MNEKFDIKLFEVVAHELGHLLIDLYIKQIEPTFLEIEYIKFNYMINEYTWSAKVKINGKYDSEKDKREYYKLVVSDDSYLLLNFFSICSGCIIQELITYSVGNSMSYKDCLNLKEGALGQRDASLIEVLKSEHRVEYDYDGNSNVVLLTFFEELPKRIYQFMSENIKIINKDFLQVSEELYNYLLNRFTETPTSGSSQSIEGSLLEYYSATVLNILNNTAFYEKLNNFYLAIIQEYQTLMQTT